METKTTRRKVNEAVVEIAHLIGENYDLDALYGQQLGGIVVTDALIDAGVICYKLWNRGGKVERLERALDRKITALSS
jgi:hypothetical protein